MGTYYQKYKRIIITKGKESPYIYLLFYSVYDPGIYQGYGSPRDLDFQGFDKFLFVPQDCPMTNPMFEKEKRDTINKTLFIQTDTCKADDNTLILNTIKWKDGSTAFSMVEWQASDSAKIKN